MPRRLHTIAAWGALACLLLSGTACDTEKQGQGPSPEESRQALRGLIDEHGEGLLELPAGDPFFASFHQASNELLVRFDSGTLDIPMGTIPARPVAYEHVAKTIGAQKVGGVPSGFDFGCRGNYSSRGGDFSVAGTKVGLYSNGGCFVVRLFDATPEIIRLLLGRDFVHLLNRCPRFRFGPFCRSAHWLRTRMVPFPGAAVALAPGAETELHTNGSWLEARVGPPTPSSDYGAIGVDVAHVRCVYELPPRSDPEVCDL